MAMLHRPLPALLLLLAAAAAAPALSAQTETDVLRIA